MDKIDTLLVMARSSRKSLYFTSVFGVLIYPLTLKLVERKNLKPNTQSFAFDRKTEKNEEEKRDFSVLRHFLFPLSSTCIYSAV